MSKPNSPCFDCQDRDIGCHGKCDKYAEYEQTKLEYSRFIAEAKRKDSVYIATMKEQKTRRLRRTGGK